jgi:hypothetical protein
MHHNIVMKVWAEDADDAKSQVSSAIEDSINPEQNNVGWDYSGDIDLITKDKLQSEYGVKTYSELEKSKLKERDDRMQDLINELHYDLLPTIAPLFLSKDEAPLYVSTENGEFKEYVEKLLKRKKDIKKPETFEKISEVILNILVAIAKKDTSHSMMMWRMEQIKKLQYCVENDMELCYTLQSSENPYAEIPCDDTKGLHAYYFVCDRHL